MPEDAAQPTGRRHEKYDRLIAAAQRMPAIGMAVAHPCDTVSLESAVEAAKLGFVKPILVGPAARVRAVLDFLAQALRSERPRLKGGRPSAGAST